MRCKWVIYFKSWVQIIHPATRFFFFSFGKFHSSLKAQTNTNNKRSIPPPDYYIRIPSITFIPRCLQISQFLKDLSTLQNQVKSMLSHNSQYNLMQNLFHSFKPILNGDNPLIYNTLSKIDREHNNRHN